MLMIVFKKANHNFLTEVIYACHNFLLFASWRPAIGFLASFSWKNSAPIFFKLDFQEKFVLLEVEKGSCSSKALYPFIKTKNFLFVTPHQMKSLSQDTSDVAMLLACFLRTIQQTVAYESVQASSLQQSNEYLPHWYVPQLIFHWKLYLLSFVLECSGKKVPQIQWREHAFAAPVHTSSFFTNVINPQSQQFEY